MAFQTKNTPSPGLRFLARGVQTRKGADAPLLPWLDVNTARNYELLRFVEHRARSPLETPTLSLPIGRPSGT